MTASIYEKHIDTVFNLHFDTSLVVDELHGGIPGNQKVAEGWIKKKLQGDEKPQIIEMARQVIMERHGIDPDDPAAATQLAAAAEKMTTTEIGELVAATRINGFARNKEGQLCLRRRHLQAMLRENANIEFAGKRWGPTKKGTKSYWVEHVHVLEDWVPILSNGEPITEAHTVSEGFVRTRWGSAIKLEEVIYDAEVRFTVLTDLKLKKGEWANIWVRAEKNGLGSSRSQGIGQFSVTKFEATK